MANKEGVKHVLYDAINNNAWGTVQETAQVIRDYFGDNTPASTIEAIKALRTFLDRLEAACRADIERAAKKAAKP